MGATEYRCTCTSHWKILRCKLELVMYILCTFCNEEIVDICNLFWEFYTIVLEAFFKNILHGKQVTKNDIFFGTENMKESFQIFSAKKIIYISRSAETIPFFHDFKMYIENVKNVEYIISKEDGKWTRWNLIWN